MILVKRLLALIICVFAASVMQAQFMDFGTDPSRFKWNKVKLPHYNLIYPQGNDSMAYNYALYLENVYPHLSKTIGKPVNMKFPVILHPASMLSNGMVSWAPRRMELIPTPSANSLSMQSFDKHLVLHESRHVFQTGKIMHGVFKPLYYIIGEQSAGLASVFVPRWFFEGDAVSTETAMSNGGRGRLPEFNMTYRAQILGTDKNYSFDKWLLGSYKNYTGDFYALGYDMASYARYRYGADIWDKTTSRFVKTVRIPWFSKSFKHFTGSNFDGLYKNTFTYLEDEWRKTKFEVLSPTYLSMEPKSYTSYRYPQALNDSVVVAVKSGLKDLNSLVTITHGQEKQLVYIGSLNSRLHLRNGRVYWTEIVPSLRWSLENYSVLKCYDLETEQVATLTPKQRYLSPAINQQGDMAAVSRYSIQGKNTVVLVDLKEGKELKEFPVPGNAFVKDMTFGTGDMVIAVAVTGTGLDLLQLDTHTGKWTELLETVSLNITSPTWKDGKVYFESGANGINNIYSFNPANAQIHQLTSSHFGAFDPSLSDKDGRLFYADYQPNGYRIAFLPVDSLLNEKANFSKPFVAPFVEILTAQEQFNLDSARLDSIDFQPERYHKLPHTFKIHSWAPFYYDVTEAMNTSADDLTTIVKPGVTVLSQNTLGTSVMQAGWYIEDGYNHGKVSYTYKGWFPVLDLAADYGAKAFDMSWVRDVNGNVIGTQGKYTGRNLLEAEARIYLPFNLTGRQYIRGIQPSVTYYLTNNKYQQYKSNKYSNFQYILPELRFYSYRKLAQQDILPRWGYQVRLQYLQSPFNSENYGSLYAARLTTYWPGIVRNHSLMLRGGYQYQSLGDKPYYLPKQLIDSPRGYDYIYKTSQQWMFKADYAFSIFSPDWNIGSLVYIKRLRANLFYDMSQNKAHRQNGWLIQSSAGLDLNLDWNVLRLSYPLTTGVRLVQPIDYGRFQAEMLFSVSF